MSTEEDEQSDVIAAAAGVIGATDGVAVACVVVDVVVGDMVDADCVVAVAVAAGVAADGAAVADSS